MKRIILLGLLMGIMAPTICADPVPAGDGAANLLQILGASPNSNVAKVVTIASLAATVYAFLETAYRRYARWAHSNDPKKANFNGFVKDLATSSLAEMGVVTYEELDVAIQTYLDKQDLQLTHDEIAQIAHDVAQQIVDAKAAQLASRIDALEKIQEEPAQVA